MPAYFISGTSLRRLDESGDSFANPNTWTTVGTLGSAANNVQGITYYDGKIYGADATDDAIYSFTVDDPGTVTNEGSLPSALQFPAAMVVLDNYFYVVNGDGNLYRYSVTANPSTAVNLGDLTGGNDVVGSATDGTDLYFVHGDSSLHKSLLRLSAADLTTPANREALGQITSAASADFRSLFYANGKFYAAQRSTSLHRYLAEITVTGSTLSTVLIGNTSATDFNAGVFAATYISPSPLMYLGDDRRISVFLGNTEVKEAYLGDTRVIY